MFRFLFCIFWVSLAVRAHYDFNTNGGMCLEEEVATDQPPSCEPQGDMV